MWTRSFLGAAVDTGLSNLYLVYMAVTKSAASFMGLQILGLLMYDGPRSRDFRDPDDPGWGGSYWLRNSQISVEYMAMVIQRARWMAPGYRKQIPHAGPPSRNINGQFEQITVVVSWLIFLQLSCHKLYDIVFPWSNHCCHAIILHGCCKQSLIYTRQEILEMSKKIHVWWLRNITDPKNFLQHNLCHMIVTG